MTSLNSRMQLALLNRKKGRNLLEKGFTLVELMIVIVIVGVLSAVALPNFLSQTSKAKATECTTRLGAILSQAGAEGLGSGSDAEKSAAMAALADTHDSDLCAFTADSSTSFVEGNNGETIFTVAVAGNNDLSGKYTAQGCVNVDTGVRNMDIKTDGGTATTANCVTTTP
jgi:type IV pilus assembly protein PilA